MTSRHIRVKNKVYEKLTELKGRLGFETYSDVVEYLIEYSTSPMALVNWFMDLRCDFKKLIREIEELNDRIRRLEESIRRITLRESPSS